MGLGAVAVWLAVYVGLIVLAALRVGETIEIVTYLDEPVDGLPEGSRVEVRGVAVGRVVGLSLAEDQRHVEVRAALSLESLTRLGLHRPGEHLRRGELPEGLRQLRAYLAPVGITSAMVLQLDLLDPERYPLSKLEFRVPWNHVPAVASSFRSLRLKLDQVVPAIPEGLATAQRVLDGLETQLDALDARALRADLEARLDAGQSALRHLEPAAVASVDSTLAARTNQLRELREGIARVQLELEAPGGRAARAEEALAGLERRVQGLDLPGLTREVREVSAAGRDALRGLAEALDTIRRGGRALNELTRGIEELTGPLDGDPGSLFYGEHRRDGPAGR